MSVRSSSLVALIAQLCLALPSPSPQSNASNPSPYPGLGDGLNFNATFTDSPQPFQLAVDPGFIETTKLKASLYRPSRDIAIDDWEDGPQQYNMTAVRDWWVHNYSWWDVQSTINQKYQQFTTTVHSGENFTHPIPLHFAHHRSNRSDAIPILMLHGWPSSFLEWDQVIDPMASPPNTSLPAFHVVAPNLPGFGFSPAPAYPGLGSREMGQAFDNFMHQLGYDRYAIYTTDLGTFIGRWMVSDAEASIVSHLTDFPFVTPNATDLARYAANQTTPEENAFIEEENNFLTEHAGYQAVHSTKPLALSQALTDSPVGFLGWVWHLVQAASDVYQYTPQQLITNALMLYIPGTYGNVRSYKEFWREGALNDTAYPSSNVPTGVTQWPSAFANADVILSRTVSGLYTVQKQGNAC